MTIRECEQLVTKRALLEYLTTRGLAATMQEAEHIARQQVPVEQQFQTAILKHLNRRVQSGELNGLFWKNQAGMYQKGGTADILGVIDGQFCAIEVKRPFFGHISPLQQRFLQAVQAVGGIAIVASYVSEVDAALTREDVISAIRRDSQEGQA